MKKQALLLLIPVIAMLSGCTQQVSLQGPDKGMARSDVTEAANAIVYPDYDPSIPDGKTDWEKMNCAQCHGADGAAVPGKATLALNDAKYMAKQKPLDQYVFLTYGAKGMQHEGLKDKLSRRQIWDLVFYVRSLAIPPISQADYEQIDAVFGSNCAVCHGKKGQGDGPLAHNMEPVPANFHQYNRFYDRDDDTLYDHIANGINWSGMPNFLGKEDKAKNVKFDEAYIRKLVQYVRRFHASNESSLAQAAPAKDK